MRSTFEGQRLDLVVAIGAPAAQFAVRHGEDCSRGHRCFWQASIGRPSDLDALPPNTAAVVVANDAPRVIETALALLPDTTSVNVVIGTSGLEDFWRTELSREFQQFRDRLTFRWFDKLSFRQMLNRSAGLPPHSIIFYSILSLDAEGTPQVEERALNELHAVATAPIFGFHSFQLGRGIVGGPLMSIEEVGERSTQAALRLLQGEAPATIKTPPLTVAAPAFDWRELRRWGIAESRLPPGSIIRFREPTMWQEYRWQIVAGAAFALLPDLAGRRAADRSGQAAPRRARAARERRTVASARRQRARDDLDGRTRRPAHRLQSRMAGIHRARRLGGSRKRMV